VGIDSEKGNLMTDDLKATIVVEIDDNAKAMSVEDATQNLQNLSNWELMYDDSRGYYLVRCFSFADSEKSREFINEMKTVCEEMHAIPDIQMNGTDVNFTCYTPRLSGLHLNDFIMAARTNDLYDRWDTISGERDKVTQASYDSFPASDPPGY